MRLDQGTIRDMADVQSSIFTMSITQYFLKHDDPPPFYAKNTLWIHGTLAIDIFRGLWFIKTSENRRVLSYRLNLSYLTLSL